MSVSYKWSFLPLTFPDIKVVCALFPMAAISPIHLVHNLTGMIKFFRYSYEKRQHTIFSTLLFLHIPY
jgi:hypothetical protein